MGKLENYFCRLKDLSRARRRDWRLVSSLQSHTPSIALRRLPAQPWLTSGHATPVVAWLAIAETVTAWLRGCLASLHPQTVLLLSVIAFLFSN